MVGVRIRPPRSVIAGLLALALVAAGCGGTEQSGDGVTLRFSWWGDDSRHEYTQKIIDIYEREHPNVTIEADYTGWEDYWDRLATNVAGGEAPDVMQQDARYVREYAEHDVLLDLGRYMSSTIDDAKLDDSMLEMGRVNGGTYAIPIGVNALGIAADPSAFAAAGVPLPDDRTWSWDDLVRIAKRITEASNSEVYGFESPPNSNDTMFDIFARQHGQTLFTEAGELGFSPRIANQWWSLLARIADSGAGPPPSLGVEAMANGISQSLLATNKAAMAVVWNNQVPAVSETAGRDLEILRIPGDSQGRVGTYLKPGMFWAASARTEHPKEAAEFIDFLINDPRAADLMLADRGLPINLDLRQRVMGQLSGADLKAARYVPEIEDDVLASPPLPPKGAGEVEHVVRRVSEKVLFGRLTVDDAVDHLRGELQSATR